MGAATLKKAVGGALRGPQKKHYSISRHNCGHKTVGKFVPAYQFLLQKRARAKSINQSFIFDLINLNSPLKKAYFNTYYCGNDIIQAEQKLTSRYCGNRWCLVCNRIRTAKLINGYRKPLDELKDPQFVTLTIKAVYGSKLGMSYDMMNKALRRIQDNMRKRYKMPIVGVRKLETNYNPDTATFNPHFHFIMEGKKQAKLLVKLWLEQIEWTDRNGQKIKPAKEGTINEIFKYMTKILTNGKAHAKSLDTIFQAMKGRRVFQSMGGLKKVCDEVKTNELRSETYKDLEPGHDVYTWHSDIYDWASKASGVTLSGYTPSPKFVLFLDNITKTDSKIFDTNYELVDST